MLWKEYGIPFNDATIEDVMMIIKLYAAEQDRRQPRKVGLNGEVIDA
jgi:hypothetical protein